MGSQHMVEVRKRDNESTDSLLRRFSRKVQQSGVLLQARKVRFFERKKGRRRMREEAMRRTSIQAERDRLIKLGELDEFAGPTRGGGRFHRSR
jgi:ribosomal protein S21